MENDGGCVICLPGVPKEMEHLWHASVVPYLQARYDLHQLIKVRLIRTAGAPEAEIDEKIGEFEQLANPTVGLAAHSGIVDVRIAAKAETEASADRMIAELEGQLRERLGTWVFGVDDDTLEGAALQAVASRTWSLVTLESGLAGALRRRLSNLLTGDLVAAEMADLGEGQLLNHLEAFRAQHNANAALGVAAFPEPKTAELALITPETRMTRSLTFGGHPGLLPRWAVNIALNWLRRTAEGDLGT
jgi:hypothetical protein